MSSDFTIVIVDYGMGNIRSIKNAIAHIGDYHVVVSAAEKDISQADALILPGVGAFPDAMATLKSKGLDKLLTVEVVEKQKPVLGICLGMQLLFDSSEEGGGNKGLGWIPGEVKKIDSGKGFRVPHVGWNDLVLTRQADTFFQELGTDKNFYFVHSFFASCKDEYVTAKFEYGKLFTAAVHYKNIVGMQFHPEKSQTNGLCALKNFIDWVVEGKNA